MLQGTLCEHVEMAPIFTIDCWLHAYCFSTPSTWWLIWAWHFASYLKVIRWEESIITLPTLCRERTPLHFQGYHTSLRLACKEISMVCWWNKNLSKSRFVIGLMVLESTFFQLQKRKQKKNENRTFNCCSDRTYSCEKQSVLWPNSR